MLEIAPGLRRWTAFHDQWEEDLGSLAVETHGVPILSGGKDALAAALD